MAQPDSSKPAATILEILTTFLRIGVMSFGGSTAPWIFSEIVERRRWMSEPAYFAGMTVAQVLPGANPVNIALYVGMEMRGGIGAIVAATGMVAPAFCVTLVLGLLYAEYGGLPVVHVVLGGLAAVGIGATAALGAKAARQLGLKVVPVAIAVAVFATVGLLHWPLIPVVLIATPCSILFTLWSERRRAGV